MYIILGCIFLLYAFFNLILIFFWYKIPVFSLSSVQKDYERCKISVVIPVRNESSNIIKLLQDLNLQTFNPKSYEVIIVDDCSEDDTLDLLKEFVDKAKFDLKIIELREKNVTSPKKKAITEAIKIAQGELIITTDGDCRVRKGWLENLWIFYQQKNAKLISGAVTFLEEKKLFERIQTVEFASLIGSGAASLQMGFPNMCNGANLAYPKSVFEEVDGYQGVDQIASGDDEFLLHKIADRYPEKIYFLKNPQNIVFTQAKPNWNDFYQQRKRWAGKWKYYKDNRIKLLAFFIFVVNSALLLSFALFCSGFLTSSTFLILILIKFVPEFVFLGIVLAYLTKKKFMIYIPLVQLIYPFYVTFFGFVAQGKTYEWKGRTLK